MLLVRLFFAGVPPILLGVKPKDAVLLLLLEFATLPPPPASALGVNIFFAPWLIAKSNTTKIRDKVITLINCESKIGTRYITRTANFRFCKNDSTRNNMQPTSTKRFFLK